MAGSKYVCPCKHVTEEDIRKAVADEATSFKQVRKATGAGSKCGKCKPVVKRLVKSLLAEQVEKDAAKAGTAADGAPTTKAAAKAAAEACTVTSRATTIWWRTWLVTPRPARSS